MSPSELFCLLFHLSLTTLTDGITNNFWTDLYIQTIIICPAHFFQPDISGAINPVLYIDIFRPDYPAATDHFPVIVNLLNCCLPGKHDFVS